MKKNILLTVIGLIALNIWAQSVKISGLQEKLEKEGFGDFKFFNDGHYEYYDKEMGESLEFEGTYIIDSEIINFLTVKSIKINGYEDDGKNLELGIPGKYRIDNEKSYSDYKGALVNINTGKVYLSKEKNHRIV